MSGDIAGSLSHQKLCTRPQVGTLNISALKFINKALKSVADLHSKILDARPPGGPNSFNFMQFLGKFGKIVCWRPPLESWRPLLGENVDPPLKMYQILSCSLEINAK